MTNLGLKKITLKRDRKYNTSQLNKMDNRTTPIEYVEDNDWRGFHGRTIEKIPDDYPSYEEDIKNRTPIQTRYHESSNWNGPSFDNLLHLGSRIGEVASTSLLR